MNLHFSIFNKNKKKISICLFLNSLLPVACPYINMNTCIDSNTWPYPKWVTAAILSLAYIYSHMYRQYTSNRRRKRKRKKKESLCHSFTYSLKPYIYTHTCCLFNPLVWRHKSSWSKCFCVTLSYPLYSFGPIFFVFFYTHLTCLWDLLVDF